MIGVRDRTTLIDRTQQYRSGSGDDRRAISRALLFANGTDERGRRLPLVFDQPRGSGRASTPPKYSDRRIQGIYAIADLDDGAPNVRLIGPRSNGTAPPSCVVRTGDASRADTPRSVSSRRVGNGGDGGEIGKRAVASRRSSGGRGPTHAVIGATALALSMDLEAHSDATTEVAARTDLRVVSRPTPMWGRRLTAFLWSMFIFGVAFLAVVLHATLAERQAALDTIHVNLERAERDHELLRVQVAKLESPDRVTALAARMGLVTPDKIRFVTPLVPVSESTSAAR